MEGIQFGNEVRILAFQDSKYRDVYVADGDSVCAYGRADRFKLSGDGTTLILIDGNTWEVVWLRRHTRVRTSAPFIGKPAPQVVELRTTPAAAALAREVLTGARVTFAPDGAVIVDPGWEGAWRLCPCGRWSRVAKPSEPGEELFPVTEPSDRVIQVGPCGWDARHSVWVAANGRTIELNRQNDLLGAGVAFVFWSPMMFLLREQFVSSALLSTLHDGEFDPAQDKTNEDVAAAASRSAEEQITPEQ